MAEESDLEKSEEPTGRRIEQAREEGQIPHSRELGTFLVLISAAVAFWLMGGWFTQRTIDLLKKGFSPDIRYLSDPDMMLPRLADLFSEALFTFLPLFVVLLVAAILPPFFLNAWVFSAKSLVPDWKKIDPFAGIGRMFSWNSLMELFKAVVKAVLIGGIAFLLIWRESDEIFGLIGESVSTGIPHAAHLLAFSFLIMAAALFLVVAADVPFQLWQYYDKLKMTKEEVKQEMKEMMGDPHVKGRIRSLQMQAARRRMMSAVPQANVVVTNPTHYSVALSYQAGMSAPKVVAKGAGEIARRIKELAVQHGVPVMEAPPLARSLYRHAELEAEIPTLLYSAVAEVLAYIYQLKQWRQEGGGYPVPPRDFDVPPELAVPEGA